MRSKCVDGYLLGYPVIVHCKKKRKNKKKEDEVNTRKCVGHRTFGPILRIAMYWKIVRCSAPSGSRVLILRTADG